MDLKHGPYQLLQRHPIMGAEDRGKEGGEGQKQEEYEKENPVLLRRALATVISSALICRSAAKNGSPQLVNFCSL